MHERERERAGVTDEGVLLECRRWGKGARFLAAQAIIDEEDGGMKQEPDTHTTDHTASLLSIGLTRASLSPCKPDTDILGINDDHNNSVHYD
uniref:Uncharacterized protein n=1 Tax=Oryza punctata TaxID=4537 RepID=A0A0E0KGW5_ORYPU